MTYICCSLNVACGQQSSWESFNKAVSSLGRLWFSTEGPAEVLYLGTNRKLFDCPFSLGARDRYPDLESDRPIRHPAVRLKARRPLRPIEVDHSDRTESEGDPRRNAHHYPTHCRPGRGARRQVV